MCENFASIVSFIRNYYDKPTGVIPLHEPLFTGNERRYVMDAIDSTFVSSVGRYVDRFEKMVCDYTGAKFAVAAVNGTAALHLCLLLAGVKRDDLVITQSLSFIATCNAIRYIGADPLFVDVAKQTLGLCADKLEVFLKQNCEIKGASCYHKQSGRRISACVPMHTFGHAVDLDKLMEICERNKILLIEDAAESIGSTYKGRHTGTSGLLGAFSFNGNKTITCGGGGMVVTNNEKLAKLGKHLSTQAKVPSRWDFEHDAIGYNYRLPNLNAAMACAQMERLDEFVAAKRKLAAHYAIFFDGIGIDFFKEPANRQSNYWLNAIFLKDREQRDSLLTYTNDEGIMTRPSWMLMTKLPMFMDCISGDMENSFDIEARLVNIPSSVKI